MDLLKKNKDKDSEKSDGGGGGDGKKDKKKGGGKNGKDDGKNSINPLEKKGLTPLIIPTSPTRQPLLTPTSVSKSATQSMVKRQNLFRGFKNTIYKEPPVVTGTTGMNHTSSSSGHSGNNHSRRPGSSHEQMIELCQIIDEEGDGDGDNDDDDDDGDHHHHDGHNEGYYDDDDDDDGRYSD